MCMLLFFDFVVMWQFLVKLVLLGWSMQMVFLILLGFVLVSQLKMFFQSLFLFWFVVSQFIYVVFLQVQFVIVLIFLVVIFMVKFVRQFIVLVMYFLGLFLFQFVVLRIMILYFFVLLMGIVRIGQLFMKGMLREFVILLL